MKTFYCLLALLYHTHLTRKFSLIILALKKLLLSYDKDGEITKDDIESFLNELGSFPTDEEIQQKIDAVDSDGEISFELFNTSTGL